MDEMVIEGSSLLRSFKAGASRVISARSELNKINVFPVADSDTGNNMASLMRSINEIGDDTACSIKETLSNVAQKALEGAKGNSGMILAQYFNGINRSYVKDENDEEHFVSSLVSAVQEAYQSVQNPQEGTMLTVMRVWANALQDLVKDNPLSKAFHQARQTAHDSLIDTENQHKLLKRHGVVDAGAKGFYEFVDGLTDSLIGVDHGDEFKEEFDIDSFSLNEELTEKPTFQYCMEVSLVANNTKQLDKYLLEQWGDSIVHLEGENQSRFHIHTNTPPEVLNILQNYGEILKIKVDDMEQQYFDMNENKQRIALVTDSIADLPFELVKQHNIHILPLTILVNETEHLDKVTLSNTHLLKLVSEKRDEISTSLPSQPMILRLFENLESTYEQVVFISVSSNLSGTYNAVNQAIKDYQGPLTISVIDSKLNSIAQGLLVKYAADYIEEGLSFNEIVEKINKDKSMIQIFVSVTDLNPMIKSGRVPQKLGRILQKLKLKPIVTLDKEGTGRLASFGLTVKQNQKRIKNRIKNSKHNVDSMLIGYTSDANSSNEWTRFFENEGIRSIGNVETSSIIALSAGASSTAVAVKYKEEKQ